MFALLLSQPDALDTDDESLIAANSITRSLRDAVVSQISCHSVKRVRTTVYKVQFTGASRAQGTATVGAEQVCRYFRHQKYSSSLIICSVELLQSVQISAARQL
jgi:hypothetical protein